MATLAPDAGRGAAWWVIPAPRPMAKVRLLCLPHAGSGPSAFLSWGRKFPEHLELRVAAPPGREHRADEPAVCDMARYVTALAEDVERGPRLPLVIFGHSLGAVVGYALARRLGECGRAPVHLVVSGRGAPTDLPATDPLHFLPDAELIAAVRDQYGGFPPEIESYPDLLAQSLATLRADLELLETWQPQLRPALDIPITVFWSPDDRGFTAQEFQDWRLVAGGPIEFRSFPGGHFYLFDRATDVIAHLTKLAGPP